jgi:hypothetical protein
MSCNLVAGIDFPSQLPTATAPFFLLGRDRTGAWVIRETSGRLAGLFCSRAAAQRYARQESAEGDFSIVECPNGLELDPLQLNRAA